MNFLNLAQVDMQGGANPDLGPVVMVVLVFEVLLIAVLIASFWKIFTKAGQPGWASLIPIYNMVVLLKIINRPIWWIVLLFIPLANFVIMIISTYDLATSFRKGIGFFVGLIFLPFIFLPILAFGDATYHPIARS